MKLILQALKAILRKIEASIDNAQTAANNAQTAANNAKSVADNAQTTADNAKSAVDSKMSATNPVASGSFSMGRASGSTVGRYSHAECFNAIASGYCSHAEGNGTKANGDYSHAEGYYTTAGGGCSHAEGGSTNANGSRSHAEGNNTKANGDYSHAEGGSTNANGENSHSEGYYTDASGINQHVQGKYNIKDTNDKYAHIVGNGTGYKRSNAHTLDWDGNAWFAGEVKVGGTEQGDIAAKTLATTEDIPTVDDTLTQPGQAADAAAVGDRLSALSEEIATEAESKVSAHNTGADTHSDIRMLIQGLTDRLNALADSDDTTLDQLSEVVAYIKSNRSLIEAITTSKVSVADIVDNLTTNVSNKPLSAAQGAVIKTLIDALRNDKLDAAELTNAINTALAQAKASGEFDGADGAPGKDGADGKPGADGKTPEYGVDYGTPEQIAGIAQAAADVLRPEVNQIKDEIVEIRERNKKQLYTTSNVKIEKANLATGTGNWAPNPSAGVKTLVAEIDNSEIDQDTIVYIHRIIRTNRFRVSSFSEYPVSGSVAVSTNCISTNDNATEISLTLKPNSKYVAVWFSVAGETATDEDVINSISIQRIPYEKDEPYWLPLHVPELERKISEDLLSPEDWEELSVATTQGKLISNADKSLNGATSDFESALVPVVAGAQYIISGWGNNSGGNYAPSFWGITDKISDIPVEYNSTGKNYKDFDVIAPEGAAWLTINGRIGETETRIKVMHNKNGRASVKFWKDFHALEKEINLEKFENGVLKNRVLKTEKGNDFAFSEFDKPYFVFIQDDANDSMVSYLNVFASENVPIGQAVITNSLNDTKITALRNLVASGGEVLAHYDASPTDDSTDELWLKCTRDVKLKLHELGFDARGIIRANNTGASTQKGEKYCRMYFDYANDHMGISDQYNLQRIRTWAQFASADAFLTQIEADCSVNGLHCYGFHGATPDPSWITPEVMQSAIQIIKNHSNCEITTYAHLFDAFGSTKLEQRIVALERQLHE